MGLYILRAPQQTMVAPDKGQTNLVYQREVSGGTLTQIRVAEVLITKYQIPGPSELD